MVSHTAVKWPHEWDIGIAVEDAARYRDWKREGRDGFALAAAAAALLTTRGGGAATGAGRAGDGRAAIPGPWETLGNWRSGVER